ncbi:hypothetical protein M407DRAFT_25918 [Tulasnella calospora MUT 4182]|uniref:Uncharacterized protein n=1 Tax=Tulasnella calospora MUT 4182 TaxID=1051891 RepID=A0A0C3Q617_9AGAM|nr:hypothetical protein M407DRAFT_25918 [Tulasnella calospora MUT 4182]
MAVSTRSSAGGASAQSKSTNQGLSRVSSKKSKQTKGAPKTANEIVKSGRKSAKRNVPSTDSDGEDADDELHPTDCSPPLKRRRKEARPLAGRPRSKSKEGSEYDSPGTDSATVPGKSGTSPQRVGPKRMPKRDKEASTKSGISTGSKAFRPHDPSGSTPATAPEQVDELSSSLSELTTSDGSPLPLPARPLPPGPEALRVDEQLPPVPQKEEDSSIIPASEPESVVPASQADSVPLASQCSSIVPASVSGSSQVMDVSCTQEDAKVGDGEELLPVTQPETTQATTPGQPNGLTQEALESFSMEESLPRSAMDTQTSGEAAGEEQDRLSYVTDEHGNENVPPTQEDAPAFALPLFNDPGDLRPAVSNDGFIPPAPVMKDLDVFSQSQPYSSQGGTQRDWPSSSQMSIVSSGGQVSPSRPTSFRYPLLPGSSSNDAAQRQFPRFESPFAQNVGTSRAVPNTKRNFALGVGALQFDEPGQVPSLPFPPPFPPQSPNPSAVEHPSDVEGEHEIIVPDDQPYQQL